MSLGLERGIVRLVPYDPAWPELFVAERGKLGHEFQRARLAVEIEHMGSTSVPELPAKPILDILLGYPIGANVLAYVQTLVDIGYEHRGEQGIPGRQFFRKGNPRSHHVHMAVIGGTFWREHLAFRDALRSQPATRAAYAALKMDLASQFPADREAYIEGKTTFVREVVRNALPDSSPA
jgi:GrpB-like predicted nucleotidyltransferase (UPF0157 family)